MEEILPEVYLLIQDAIREHFYQKGFIEMHDNDGKKTFSIMNKGHEFLQEYKVIENFVENFGL